MTGKLEYNMNRYRLLSGNLVSDVEQFEQGTAYAAVTSDNMDQLRRKYTALVWTWSNGT
ncbi:hypothetical protein [Paenibacillus sp. QZ-Y1]|uniref:hypothetical protein n=1 Tax=Paenibacillus sp. QZ-Y1 TaxID=3414511 RepID=UPI003F7A67B7